MRWPIRHHRTRRVNRRRDIRPPRQNWAAHFSGEGITQRRGAQGGGEEQGRLRSVARWSNVDFMDHDGANRLLERYDPDAARQLVINVSAKLDGLAAQVWAFGMSAGPRRAVAIVAQMGAELALGASQLYEARRWYAGAALVRQLIETEYLLYLFGTDNAEPERWLSASSEEGRAVFSPTSMRKRSRGRFRSSEYSVHCEFGGHPRPKGHFLLREHFMALPGEARPFIADPRFQWVDLAQHLVRFWDHYVAAVALHSPSNVYPDTFNKIRASIDTWQATVRPLGTL